MDWKTVGRLIGPLAPVAGSILGGLVPFPGGEFIGQKLGEFIAEALGVPATPAAVASAAASTPDDLLRAKIADATERARVEIAGFVDLEKATLHAVEVGLVQTGETMRAQIGHEHWFFSGWRPAIGWVFVAEAIMFGAMLTAGAWAAAFHDNPRPLAILNESWPIFAAYFATLGLMVGVLIPSRSMEKKAAITSNTPMPNAKPPPPRPVVRPPIQEPRT